MLRQPADGEMANDLVRRRVDLVDRVLSLFGTYTSGRAVRTAALSLPAASAR